VTLQSCPSTPSKVGLQKHTFHLFHAAGDSWGEIAVPVIQEHPGTAIIFVPFSQATVKRGYWGWFPKVGRQGGMRLITSKGCQSRAFSKYEKDES